MGKAGENDVPAVLVAPLMTPRDGAPGDKSRRWGFPESCSTDCGTVATVAPRPPGPGHHSHGQSTLWKHLLSCIWNLILLPDLWGNRSHPHLTDVKTEAQQCLPVSGRAWIWTSVCLIAKWKFLAPPPPSPSYPVTTHEAIKGQDNSRQSLLQETACLLIWRMEVVIVLTSLDCWEHFMW